MPETLQKAVAIVGVGAVLPDAPDAPTFWNNLESGRYSISDVQPDRWDPALYYDPDPKAPDRSYSKIGGWVREWSWEPLQWRMPIPPRVGEAMDRAQKWAIIGAREALADDGYPDRPLNPDRTAVIFGNAMAGDQHYMTALRVFFPEYARELGNSPSFIALPESVQEAVTGELHGRILDRFPDINEDTMPGELANIIAGRVAAVFDFHGPNYVVNAACASAMAGMSAAIEGLENFDFDSVITGGIDANMSASSFIKFCKIGALSPSGTRPYAEGADGFVMGEGAALFLLKRLEDAVSDEDRIYAVIRGFGGASDGKGKGITAPNPIGQRLAVERAWKRSGLQPVPGDLMEGHGTSTRVGDIVEVESMSEAFRGMNLPAQSIPLGSVKSNFGHLKGAAGAAGMLKAALSLHHKMLPPSLGVENPNPNIDWEKSPFYVNTELQPWEKNGGGLRQAGVSAFGFGGTNFHMVLEEYVPGITDVTRKKTVAVEGEDDGDVTGAALKAPPRGALVLGADDRAALAERLNDVAREAESGEALPPVPPWEADLNAPVRVAIDYVDAENFLAKLPKALKELNRERSAAWSASRAQGIFVDEGDAPKVAFLYTGQGSQYVNMLAEFREVEPIVAETFAEADRVMTPLLGKPLTDYIFIDEDDAEAMARASEDLRQTEITQPAVLTVDVALTRLLAVYGITPDMVMGHSLGEYCALVGAGALSFADALEAVSARGQGMAQLEADDNGTMAAILGPLEGIQKIVDSTDGYVVVANINSTRQAVIGGATAAVDAAIEACQEAGFRASKLPVSHAFHTEIVAPAIGPLREVLDRLDVQSPVLPIIANISGDFYPMGPDVRDDVIDILGRQIASPVQFVAGLQRLYDAGARVFVEVGPKSALHGFVKDVLGDHDDSRALFTNHPKQGDLTSFNRGLCGLYAAGLGVGRVPDEEPRQVGAEAVSPAGPSHAQPWTGVSAAGAPPATQVLAGSQAAAQLGADNYLQLGRIFADAIQQGMGFLSGEEPARARESIVISGAALGLPGTKHVFDDANIARILSGEQFIESIPMEFRQAMVDKNITRLVKGPNGEARFEIIEDPSEAIKLAARGGTLDLAEEFGFPEDRLPSLDTVTRLAIGAGIDVLRDAGIPLIRRYKTTTKGTKLPDGWCLPDEMRDDTGVIFASAFPGYDALLDEVERFHADSARCQQLETLIGVRDRLPEDDGSEDDGSEDSLRQEIETQIANLEAEIEADPYVFDRRFLFKVLAFGHAQFAEMIGARGPNTQVNAACASGGQALGLAEDWIHSGRCRRVIVISADNTTSDNLIGWIGAGFLASGAAATDEDVEDAAIPFDRRRHGLIIGMGAAAMVIESASSVAERGMQPICEVLGTVVANSAFHGSRLDVHHIAEAMEAFVAKAEASFEFDRQEIAPHLVFVSHETYTPARGGSAQAEATALQRVFGDAADEILVANTKGYTGHPMGVGIEEVVAVKMLETGIVPPVANHRELDPELGYLNLSRGGDYPVQFALRLAAGFGSQLAMSLLRWVPTSSGERQSPYELGHSYRIADATTWDAWLQRITGYSSPELEVEYRTLRVKDEGPPKVAVPSAPPAIPAHEVVAPVSAPPVSPAAPVSTVPVVAPPVEPPVAPPVEPLAAAVAAEEPAVAPMTPVPSDPVEEKILELVTQQTGYPPDMLDMDLDLEADLGIDTVKQAEMFAAIREAYDIPRDDDLQLRDFPTLKDVVRFVYERRPDLGGPPEVSESVAATATADEVAPAHASELPVAADVSDPVQEKILELVTEQTGYPPDMLDMDLDLEADLGVDTVKQAEMFAAIREAYDIPREDELQLRDFPTLNDVVRFVYERRPDLGAVPEEDDADDAGDALDGGTAPVALAVSDETALAPADLVPPDASAAPSETPPDVDSVPAAVAPVAADAVTDPVALKILELVGEKTGYPPDMLEMDLDLEADLGIDTVKQAEMFVSIRAEYDIPRDDDLQLRDFPTLNDVVRFVYERLPDAKTDLQEELDALQVTVLEEAGEEADVLPVAELEEAGEEADVLPVTELEEAGEEADVLPVTELEEADEDADALPVTEVEEADEELEVPPVTALERAATALGIDLEDIEAARRAAMDAAAEVTAETEPTEVAEIAEEAEPDELTETEEEVEPDESIETAEEAEPDESTETAEVTEPDEPTETAEEVEPDESADSAEETEPDEPAETVEEVEPDEPSELEGSATGAIPGLIEGSMEAAQTIPRRVPIPVLRPSLDLCKETGVQLGAESRVIIMADLGGVGTALAIRLEKLGAGVLMIEDTPTCEELEERIATWLRSGPIQGLYWLPALDHEGDLGKLDPESWHAAVHTRVKLLYTAMRVLYDQIGDLGTFLVSGTRLGGQHGYDADGAVAPLGGPVAGLTKTFKRERPDALVKVVDFEPSQKTAAEAEILIQETLRDPGAVEIGIKGEWRWTITLEEQELLADELGLELGPDSVFVVTGAAGSIVSAITADLAQASGGIFYLLDLVAEPDPDDPEIDRVVTDRDNLKRDLFERIKERGERATPAMVDRELAGLERAQSAAAAIRAVREAGGEAHYHSVDLMDSDAVARVIDEVRESSGRIDVLLHAAGLEISHMMPEKEAKEFNLVFDVKADGWFNMLHAIGDMPLGATVVFSSIAGRFGNAGQADYSAANDLLCKTTSSFRTTRPETRGIAIDWTAWGGIGMATRGSIPLVMKEAGIDMLPPEAGVTVIRRELTTGGWRGEVLIGERLGILLNEWDETGGLDVDGGPMFQNADLGGVMVSEVAGMGLYSGLTVQTTLDPGEQAFLYDHQIEGTPVLPGVMGIEAFAEAAGLPFPDLHVAAVEDVNFLTPFKFYRGEPRTVTVQAAYRTDGDDVIADCRLLGSRTLVGQDEPQVIVHFTGRVRLSAEPPTAPAGVVPSPPEGEPISAADIYRIYFHGPAYQVIEGAWRLEDGLAGLWAEDLPENHSPETLPTVMEPRLVEFCVQMASLWDLGMNGRMGLPHHLDRVSRMHSLDEAEGGLYVVVRPDPESGFHAYVVDDTGKVYVMVSGYRTVELPVGLDPDLLQPLRDGMKPPASRPDPVSEPERESEPGEASSDDLDADTGDDNALDYGSESGEIPDPEEDGTW